MRVIDLPGSLDFQTCDALLAEVAEAGAGKSCSTGGTFAGSGPTGW